MKLRIHRPRTLGSKGFSHVEMVFAVLVIGVVAFVGVRVLGGSHADVTIASGQIIYSEYTTANTEGIRISNPDGSAGFFLTHPPTNDIDSDAVWSPNKQKIAFIRFEKGVPPVLYTMNADGSALTPIKTGSLDLNAAFGTDELAWSPDSTQLAVSVYDPAQSPSVDQVAMIKVSTSALSLVPGVAVTASSSGTINVFGWDASGMIYYTNPLDYAVNNICRISTTGTGFNCFAKGFGPALSPNGKQVAFNGYNGNTTGGLSDGKLHLVNVDGTSPSIISSATYTNINNETWSPDGTQLIFLAVPSGGSGSLNWYLINVNGTGTAEMNLSTVNNTPTSTISWRGVPGDIPVPADYTGTGKATVAIWRPSTGTWYVKGVETVKWGQAGDIPVPGDYSGSGKAQLVVWRPSNATWYVYGGTSVKWGQAGDIPMPGFYLGNGKMQMAVYRPTNGVLYVYGGTSYQLIEQPGYNLGGVQPAVADYNGKGKDNPVVVFTDGSTPQCWLDLSSNFCLSVYGISGVPFPNSFQFEPGYYYGGKTAREAYWNPTDGTWHVANAAGTASQEIVQYGAQGDIPVPADYTGSGTTQFAVWRPSNATWYIRGGTNVQWGAPWTN